MEQNQQQQQPPQQQRQQQPQFRCTGECIKCPQNQRQYCSAQVSYNTMRMMEDVQFALASMQGTIKEMNVKIDAIQGNEAMLFNPTHNDESEETLKSPRETLKSPSETLKAPLETLKAPLETLKAPLETLKAPIAQEGAGAK